MSKHGRVLAEKGGREISKAGSYGNKNKVKEGRFKPNIPSTLTPMALYTHVVVPYEGHAVPKTVPYWATTTWQSPLPTIPHVTLTVLSPGKSVLQESALAERLHFRGLKHHKKVTVVI